MSAMTATAQAPFRADHVGSLLRPSALLQAREEHAAGKIDGTALTAAEDEAVREVVAMQREAGLRSATDSEFRRASWHMDFIYALGGISRVEDESLHVRFHNEDGDIEFAPPSTRIDGTVRLDHTIFGDAFAFLRDAVADGVTPKLTILSPSMVHYRGGRSAIDASVYPDLDDLWSDLTDAYAAQIRGVHELGCRYLQLDDTLMAISDSRIRITPWRPGDLATHGKRVRELLVGEQNPQLIADADHQTPLGERGLRDSSRLHRHVSRIPEPQRHRRPPTRHGIGPRGPVPGADNATRQEFANRVVEQVSRHERSRLNGGSDRLRNSRIRLVVAQ